MPFVWRLLWTLSLLAVPGLLQAEPKALEEALSLDRQGFVQEALPFWKTFAASQPDRDLAIYAQLKIGAALSQAGKLGAALDSARKLADRFPGNFHAQFNLGNIASAIRQFPQAVEAYAATVKIRPEEGLGYVGLGLTLFGSQETERSVKTLRQVRRLFKKQKNISWYQNVRIMIGQMKSFAPYPPDFANLWLSNNLKEVRETYMRTLFLDFEKELNL